MSIEEYLQGKVAYDVPTGALATILVDRNVEPETDVADVDMRTRDLCTADLYMWCASTPSTKNKVEDADGQWKHSDGGWATSAYDKRQLRAMANDIYAKYDESQPQQSTVRVINL